VSGSFDVHFPGREEDVRWGAFVPAPRGNFLVWVVQNGRRAIRPRGMGGAAGEHVESQRILLPDTT